MTTEQTITAHKTGLSFGLWHLSLLLAAIGVVISGYLSYVKLADAPIICVEGEAFNCDLVQNSAYAKFMGIDVAYLGLAGYLLIGALLVLETRVPLLVNYGHTIIFGLTLFAFVFSMWLVYVQAAILQAACSWCLAHEVNITALLIVVSIRLWKSLQSDDE
jgi:uncharacterized membrane protein